MPQLLDFVPDFTRVRDGALEPPDPFEGMSGVLDGWMANAFDDKQRRPRPWSRQILIAPDDGDPGHTIADQRASDKGIDVQVGNVDLLELARSQIGAPYVWADLNPVGAEGGPGAGFDCSGFTQWVLSRFGIQTEHLSAGQQKQFRKVGRSELQAGDLVFYHYSDRNGPGDTADHVEMYIGNGQTIGSSGGGVMVRQVDWEHFVGGGATGIAAEGQTSGRTPIKHGQAGQAKGQPEMAPVLLVDDLVTGGSPAFGSVLASLLQPTARATPRTEPTRGARGSIQAQLRNGFLDAGRPDLAKMVGTQDFQTWVAAESGWDPGVTSKYFPGHGVNYGLFQFWEGHAWTANYVKNGEFTADPYTQAKLVARYFSQLTPDDIHRYAAAIRNGTYSGWPT